MKKYLLLMIDFLIVDVNDDDDDEILTNISYDNHHQYELILHVEYEFVLGTFKIKEFFQNIFQRNINN